MRRVPIPLFAGFVFCGHAFNSTTLCWLPLNLPRTTQICSSGTKKENQKNCLCLAVSCCQRFQSWPSVGNFRFLREHCMEIKKEKRNKQRQSSSCNSSYLEEKLYCLTFLETNMKRKTPFFSKKIQQKKLFPNAKSMVSCENGRYSSIHTASPFSSLKAMPLSRFRQLQIAREKQERQGSLAWTEITLMS